MQSALGRILTYFIKLLSVPCKQKLTFCHMKCAKFVFSPCFRFTHFFAHFNMVEPAIKWNMRKSLETKFTWQYADIAGSLEARVCNCSRAFVSHAVKNYDRGAAILKHHAQFHEHALLEYVKNRTLTITGYAYCKPRAATDTRRSTSKSTALLQSEKSQKMTPIASICPTPKRSRLPANGRSSDCVRISHFFVRRRSPAKTRRAITCTRTLRIQTALSKKKCTFACSKRYAQPILSRMEVFCLRVSSILPYKKFR